MSNILIQNRGELPIWGLRLLGLSNKTEDQIGQFGTGLKESIAMLARMDSLPIIYSGECRVEFSVIENDPYPAEIHFKLSHKREQFEAEEWYGLGMHPDFGKADWNDAWMIFREIVCNAIDESGVEDLVHDIVYDDPEGVAGSTRVFIPVSTELIEGYDAAQHRLLALSEHEITAKREGTGSAIAKRGQETLQLFHRGVYVQQTEEKSLRDYELNQIKLSESRSADWYNTHIQMASVIALFTATDIYPLLDTIIVRPDGEQYYEEKVLTTVAWHLDVENGKEWKTAFEVRFGTNAVLCENDKFLYDKVKDLGMRPIVCKHAGLLVCLKNAGVPDAETVLTSDQKSFVKLQEPTTESRELFDRIWGMFVVADMTQGKDQPELMIFTPRVGAPTVVFGMYQAGMCKINCECVGSEHERTAMVEEIAHHVTGADDESREFQHFLVESLTKHMFERVAQ